MGPLSMCCADEEKRRGWRGGRGSQATGDDRNQLLMAECTSWYALWDTVEKLQEICLAVSSLSTEMARQRRVKGESCLITQLQSNRGVCLPFDLKPPVFCHDTLREKIPVGNCPPHLQFYNVSGCGDVSHEQKSNSMAVFVLLIVSPPTEGESRVSPPSLPFTPHFSYLTNDLTNTSCVGWLIQNICWIWFQLIKIY